eukprot:scaffold109651_cov53-Attheya_sp.AAC.4
MAFLRFQGRQTIEYIARFQTERLLDWPQRRNYRHLRPTSLVQLATRRLAVPGRTNRQVHGTRLNCLPYLKDLEATNGAFLNDVQIDAARYYQLKKGDVLKFGLRESTSC